MCIASVALVAVLAAGTIVNGRLAARSRHLAEEAEQARRAEEAGRREAEWQAYLAGVAAALSALHAGDHRSAGEALRMTPVHLRGHDEGVRGLAVRGDRVLTADRAGRIRAWSLRGDPLGTAEGRPAYATVFDGSGRLSFGSTGGRSGLVSVREVGSGRACGEVRFHERVPVRELAFDTGRDVLAARTRDGWLAAWSLERRQEVARRHVDHEEARGLAFSPDGRWLAVAQGAGIQVMEASDLSPRACLTGHTDTIEDLTFHPDGTRLASASRDGTLRLWDTRSWRYVATVLSQERRLYSVAFSPDGRWLAAGDGLVEVPGCVHLREAPAAR